MFSPEPLLWKLSSNAVRSKQSQIIKTNEDHFNVNCRNSGISEVTETNMSMIKKCVFNQRLESPCHSIIALENRS